MASLLQGKGSEGEASPASSREASQVTQQSGSSPLNTELLVAARKGDKELVARCLREGGGAGATVTDKYGRTCLHLACHYGHMETASIILQSGLVDINTASRRGSTPLHEASSEGHLPVVLLLLAHGAFIKARNRDGATCLMSACQNGHLRVARALVAAGCDVTATNTVGYTPLHLAAWKGHSSIVELMLKEGGSLTAEAINGKTPYQLALEEKHHDIMTIIHAGVSRESEEPFYRIASLEGQLRQCQDKLRENQHHHDAVVASERAAEERQWLQVTQQLKAELEAANSELASLKFKRATETTDDVEEKTGETPPIPKLTVNDSGESPGTRAKSKKKKDKTSDLLKEEIHLQRKGSLGSALLSPKLTRSSRARSGSQETLDTLGLDKLEHRDVARTIHDEERGNGKKRPSISQLIAENSNNPQSMAAIRKELKADNLTPKLQKKFQKPTIL